MSFHPLYYDKPSKVSHTTTTKVTTEETTSSTTTTTEEATTTTEIKTTTSTTTSKLKNETKAELQAAAEESERPENGIQQKLEDLRPDLKPLAENYLLHLDEVINQDVPSEFLNSRAGDPTVLFIGKDKSECSNLVLIFDQLKFQFKENYNNLEKSSSTNVPAIIFCSYSAYFNFKKSKNFQQFEHTPTLLFPYFTEAAQFEIQNAELEVKHIAKNATYQFKIAESKFNRVAKASQVIHNSNEMV